MINVALSMIILVMWRVDSLTGFYGNAHIYIYIYVGLKPMTSQPNY